MRLKNLSVFSRVGESIRRHGSLRKLLHHLLSVLKKEGMIGLRFRLRRVLLGGDLLGASPIAPYLHPRSTTDRDSLTPCLPPGVLLVGHPYAILGRAEDIRTVACSLDAVRIPFAMRNLLGEYGRQWAKFHRDFSFLDRIDDTATFRANLFVLNANEMETAWQLQGDTFRSGHYNIGYWAWELSRFPSAWIPAFAGLHEIWAPSRFIQQAIGEIADIPVIWMPLAVQPNCSHTPTRALLGLPKDKFLFLFFFDFRSFVARKNPWDIIRAFHLAFKHDNSNVRLVIKINGMEDRPGDYQDFLASEFLDDPRLILINRVMADWEIYGLMSQCDCFISLHRSEGFGRGLAEAMYMGKPVIATGYSGNLDYMNQSNCCLVDHRLIPVHSVDYPFGQGQFWAEPDVDMAAAYMRRVSEDENFAQNIGQTGADYIRRHHSYSAVGKRYRRRLEMLGLV